MDNTKENRLIKKINALKRFVHKSKKISKKVIRLFHKIDTDKSGTLEPAELLAALCKAGQMHELDDVKMMAASVKGIDAPKEKVLAMTDDELQVSHPLLRTASQDRPCATSASIRHAPRVFAADFPGRVHPDCQNWDGTGQGKGACRCLPG